MTVTKPMSWSSQRAIGFWPSRREIFSLPNILPFALGCFVGLGRADRPVRNGRAACAASACEWGECALRCGWPGIFQAFGSDWPDGGGARREMVAAAWSLLGAPSLRRMCETWTLTVLTLMTSAAAISRLV